MTMQRGWHGLWHGTWSATWLTLVFVVLAVVALSFSGSWFQALRALVEQPRADEGIAWEIILQAFFRDITGTPGLFVAAIKTVFAAVIAFGVALLAPTVAGDLVLKVLTVELSGAQSRAILWCAVFTLVKLL